MYSITRTPALRDFRDRIGNSTFHINSAYVGLEWIARGGGKPEGMEINWDPPKNPRSSVDQARQLIHSAMLGYVFEAADAYLRQIADIDWLDLTQYQKDILLKSTTKPGREAYAIHERFDAVATLSDEKAAADLEMLKALVAWRNQQVHDQKERRGEFRLPNGCEAELLARTELYADRYGRIDVSDMIKQADAHEPPRRKEIIALVSATQNFVREFDAALVKKALDQSKLESLACAAIRQELQINDWAGLRKVWAKPPDVRERKICAILDKNGFVKDPDAICKLPEDFTRSLSRLSQLKAQGLLSR
jgi:hypothetical protein